MYYIVTPQCRMRFLLFQHRNIEKVRRVTPRTMTRKKTVGDGRYSSKAFYQADLGARHKNGKHVEMDEN